MPRQTVLVISQV